MYGTWILCTCAFACTMITVMMLRVKNHPYIVDVLIKRDVNESNSYIRNRPLEYVDVGYKRNIFFTVKTTSSNYHERLSTLMLTWFQTVHRDDVSLATMFKPCMSA